MHLCLMYVRFLHDKSSRNVTRSSFVSSQNKPHRQWREKLVRTYRGDVLPMAKSVDFFLNRERIGER